MLRRRICSLLLGIMVMAQCMMVPVDVRAADTGQATIEFIPVADTPGEYMDIVTEGDTGRRLIVQAEDGNMPEGIDGLTKGTVAFGDVVMLSFKSKADMKKACSKLKTQGFEFEKDKVLSITDMENSDLEKGLKTEGFDFLPLGTVYEMLGFSFVDINEIRKQTGDNGTNNNSGGSTPAPKPSPEPSPGDGGNSGGVVPSQNTINTKADDGIVKVGVVDSGVDMSSITAHNPGRVVTRIGSQVDDVQGHGTVITRIVLDNTDNAQVISVRSFDKNGDSTVALTVAAMQSAVDAGCDILNLSFAGSGTSKALEQQIDAARAKGVAVLCASGNEHDNADSYMPGNMAGSWNISACEETSSTSYANTGSCVDFCAEGKYFTDETHYIYGTSMACGVASASVATAYDKLKADAGEVDLDKMYASLAATATDLGTSGKDYVFGYGKLSKESGIAAADYLRTHVFSASYGQ